MGKAKNLDKAELPQELIELLDKPDSVKVLGTLNADGSPRLAINKSLTTLDGKTLILSEELEKTLSNKNLVRSIWFDKRVSVYISNGPVAYEVRASVNRCFIIGGQFVEMLTRARKEYGPDADITDAWELIPREVVNVSPEVVRREQQLLHPFLDIHLDRASIRV
ncbi:MAG TPA: hypothetical protein VN381_02600 [Anaerovoracaceae bacterium]|nr:hypothetical protein [Anaerovoracaceae bacterium]